MRSQQSQEMQDFEVQTILDDLKSSNVIYPLSRPSPTAQRPKTFSVDSKKHKELQRKPKKHKTSVHFFRSADQDPVNSSAQQAETNQPVAQQSCS